MKNNAAHPDALHNYLVGSGIEKRERFFLECMLNRLDKMIIDRKIDNEFEKQFRADIPDLMHILWGVKCMKHIKHERGLLNHFVWENNWDLDDFIYDRRKEYGL